MKRVSPKCPLTLHLLGALFFLVFSLTGSKLPSSGEIIQQEGVFYRTEGLQFQKTGELQAAAASFRRAIYIKPDYAEAYNDLGVVLESLGNLEEAEEAYKTALKFKPNLGSAHSNLGLLYEESDRVKQAAVHWVARFRLGPSRDPWAAAAREKLDKYQLSIPETAADKTRKKDFQIRQLLETGKAHLDVGRPDKAIEEFEHALKIDPAHAEASRLLRLARTRVAQAQGRQIRELEAAKGRVTKEAATARHKEAARKAELERERPPVKQFQDKKQAARQLKELEETRRKAAQRIEAESRAEKIKARAAADLKFKELEKARRRAEKAKPVKPPVAPVVKPVAEVKVKPEPSTAPLKAQALAREIVKERSKVRGKASDDLVRRVAIAMREGLYQDAIEIYKQILILEPGNRSAKQGLERAQKALAKQL